MKLTRCMFKTIVHHEGAGALASAGIKGQQSSSAVKPREVDAGPVRSVIKLGVDVHAKLHVVVAQHDHALPRPPRRFEPYELVPWVESLLRAGHTVHVVYEACGFGFGLCRALQKAGAHCLVVAPQRLDERRTRVKTDARDAQTLCQRLSRYLDGNAHELAVVRVPTESEERARHVHRQREVLVRHRCKLEATGRGMLVNHGLPAPAHWHHAQTFSRLKKLLPEWILPLLETFRPVLLELEKQIAAMTMQLEADAPAQIPRGIGRLTSVVLSREVCDWRRFKNRRQVASYTGLCPGEHSSGAKRVQGSVTKRGNPRLRSALVELAWRLVRFQPEYPPVKKRMHILCKGARATGAARKKAIVAVARQLAVDHWRLCTGRCHAAQLGLQFTNTDSRTNPSGC